MAEEWSAYLETQGMFLEWNLRTIKGKMKSVVVVVAEGGSARSERGNGGIRASERGATKFRVASASVRLIKVAAPPPPPRRLIRFFALPRAPCRSRGKVPKMQLKFLTKYNDVWKSPSGLKVLKQHGMSLQSNPMLRLRTRERRIMGGGHCRLD